MKTPLEFIIIILVPPVTLKMAKSDSKQFPAASKYREPSSRNERPLSREEREMKHLARDFYREEKEIMKSLEKSFKKASLPIELE